jgi:hypothetical protein
VIRHLKGGIVETEETVFVRRRLDKHMPTATDTHAKKNFGFDVLYAVRVEAIHISKSVAVMS